eukprot:4789998-Ditylum_brightwellii.AAC.1
MPGAIVIKVLHSRVSGYFKIALANFVCNPEVLHVHDVGFLLLDGIIDNAIRGQNITVGRCRQLVVP